MCIISDIYGVHLDHVSLTTITLLTPHKNSCFNQCDSITDNLTDNAKVIKQILYFFFIYIN